MTMTCNHDTIRDIRERCFAGPVASDENRAAHGNITITEECAGCGRRRHRNVNGRHEEVGPWGPSASQRRRQRERELRQLRAQREQAQRELRDLLDGRPGPVVFRRGESVAEVAIDGEGYLVALAEGGDAPNGKAIAACCPDLVDYACRVRRAHMLYAWQPAGPGTSTNIEIG